MMPLFSSSVTEPNGGYVVARPERTDAIGGILRASFRLGNDDAGADFRRLLVLMDQPARPS